MNQLNEWVLLLLEILCFGVGIVVGYFAAKWYYGRQR